MKKQLCSLFQKLCLLLIFSTVCAAFAVSSYFVFKQQNAAVQLHKILVNNQGRVAQAFFSPDTDIKEILLSLIDSEQEAIYLAIYSFTQLETAKALLRAQKRGVRLEVVSDREFAVNRASKIPMLANNQAYIWVLQNHTNHIYTPLMHNKFIVFKKNFDGRSLVWTGSYNITQQANARNQENVVIFDNQDIIAAFTEQFQRLKERSLQISGGHSKKNPKKTIRDQSKQLKLKTICI